MITSEGPYYMVLNEEDKDGEPTAQIFEAEDKRYSVTLTGFDCIPGLPRLSKEEGESLPWGGLLTFNIVTIGQENTRPGALPARVYYSFEPWGSRGRVNEPADELPL